MIINKKLKNNFMQVLAFSVNFLEHYCPYHDLVTMALMGFTVCEYAAKCLENLSFQNYWSGKLRCYLLLPSEQLKELEMFMK